MIVKLKQGMAGPGCSRASFLPRQIIKMSDRTAARYIEIGAAEEAPKGSIPEGELFDETAEEKVANERPAKPEKAVQPAPETPESGAHCAGQTAKGNPCLKAPAPGSQFCAAHSQGD